MCLRVKGGLNLGRQGVHLVYADISSVGNNEDLSRVAVRNTDKDKAAIAKSG